MIYAHLTATGPVAANKVWAGPAKKAIIQVNEALTGAITVSDETATAGTPVVAVITNPTVGTKYEFWGFNTGVTVVPAAGPCDITVSVDTSARGAS